MAQREIDLDATLHSSIADDYLEFESEELKKITLHSLLEEKNFFAICQALHSCDSDVVTGAALLLGRLKDARAVPFLLEAFLTTVAQKGQAIAWALGEIGSEEALPFFYEALRAGFVKKSVLVALGKIGAINALPALLEVLKSRDENQRALAVKAIGLLRYQGAYEKAHALKMILRHLERESSRAVRLAICVVAARLEKF